MEKEQWQNILTTNNNFVHIAPIDDIKGHTFGNLSCKCMPKIDVGKENGREYKLAIHNAYDKRQVLEEISDKFGDDCINGGG